MTKVLVTGARGFVGRHFCSHLAGSHDLVAVDKAKANHDVKDSFLPCIEADITEDGIASIVPPGIETIVHLAAITGIEPAKRDPVGACDVNCLATLRLLEYAKSAGVKHFVYVSTGSVYRPQRDLVKESTPADPQNFYGLSKYLGELVAMQYTKCFAVTVLRLFHPYASDEPANNLVSRITDRIRAEKPIAIHAGDRPLLSFTHIKDLMKVMTLVVDGRPDGIINVAGGNATFAEMCRILGACMGVLPRFVRDEAKVENEAADIVLMKSILGYVPQFGIESGLREYLDGRGVL